MEITSPDGRVRGSPVLSHLFAVLAASVVINNPSCQSWLSLFFNLRISSTIVLSVSSYLRSLMISFDQ